MEIEVDTLEQMCDLMCGDYDLVSRTEVIEAVERIATGKMKEDLVQEIWELPGRGTE